MHQSNVKSGSAICYRAAKSEAVLDAPFMTIVAGRKNIEVLTQFPLNNKLEADIKFI